MGTLAGNSMVVKISETEMAKASDGTELEYMDSSSLSEMVEIHEVLSFGDVFKQRKAGISDSSLSLSGSLSPTSSGQMLIRPGKELYVGVFPSGLTSAGTQIPMIIESVETSAEVAGIQKISISLLGNGNPTVIPVA